MLEDTQPFVGDLLAGYRIEAFVGKGSMGEVYRALDTRLGRYVALKLLAPRLADNARFRERFLRESRLAASLDHPNVIPVYEAGEAEGRLFIAMRFVEGSDLRRLLDAEGVLEPARALSLLDPVAGALDTAHAKGLVHRDVKPANVLVAIEPEADPPEHVYLSDFGLTTLSSDPSEEGPFSGTADYAAPELVAGGAVDGRADVYALACVLFECLTGEPPFRGDSVMAVLWAHVNDPPPAPSVRNAELPEAIDGVLRRGLTKDPAERQASCRVLVDDAGAALGLDQAAPTLSRRRLLVVGGAGALAIAAAAAVPAALLTGRGRKPRPLLPLKRDSLVWIDPQANEVAAAIGVGTNPAGVAAGDSAVWAVSPDEKILSRVDPKRRAVVKAIDVSRAGSPDLVAAGEGVVWTADSQEVTFNGHQAWAYHVRTGSLTPVPSGGGIFISLAYGEGSLWVGTARSIPNVLLRIDPATGRIVSTVEDPSDLEGFALDLLAVDEGAVWVTGKAPTEEQAALRRVDLATNRIVARTKLSFSPADIAVGEGSVWLTDPASDSVVRVDPQTSQIADTVRVGRLPHDVAVGEGSVWVGNTRDPSVTRINPESLDVQTIDVGGIPADIAVGGGVWVTVVAE